MSENNYDIIIKKLDAFISKYYKNLIIKGILYLLLISFSLFIVLAISEYFGHFSMLTRRLLFYIYIAVFLLLFIRFILLPVLALFRISRHLNHQQAAKIIGKYFSEIDDKLSNILQLQRFDEVDEEQRQLIEAGIAQKTELIKPFPILSIIDFKANTKYLKYLLIPLIIIFITWLVKPHFIEDPTIRLVHYNSEFELPQAFSIKILNKELIAFQKDDYQIDIEVKGDELPEKLFINYGKSRFILNRISGNHFNYIFKSIRKSQDFFISDGFTFISKTYHLIVHPKAVLSDFNIEVIPPEYTGLSIRKERNIGDLKVAEGSRVIWTIKTKDCEELKLEKDSVPILLQSEDEVFTIQDTIIKSADYKVYTSNKYMENSDSMLWMIEMIRDEYPQIQVETIADSNDRELLYFNGYIDDDYGFSKLRMIIEYNDERVYENVAIDKKTKPQRFYHYIDFKSIDADKGSDVFFYFQVFDNDAWNGPKSSKSIKEMFHFDSYEELMEERNQDSDSLKTEMKESLKELKELNKKIKDFKKELVNKELLSWDDKKKIEDLLKEQQKLQEKVENFKKQNENINDQSNDINQNERILDKQEQLEELFEQVMDEETKKKMEELRKMLEEMNKENSQEMLEQMEMSAEELEDQLDRNLELFKQLEFEMRLEENIEDLKKLAEEQKKLAEETKKSSKKDADELKQKQDSINQKFDEIKDELSKLDSLNSSLEEPNNFDKKEEEQQKVDSLQDASKQDLEKQKMDDASEKQKEAGEQMQEMADQMQAQMDANEMEDEGEDMEALRAILDHLIKLSFIQESLMDTLNSMEDMDPNYNQIVREQFAMEAKFQSTKDSLSALAARQPKIKSYVVKEFNKIEFRLKSCTDYMEEHKRADAIKEQQFIMTSFNQLALMLNEALENMQEMMQQMMMKGNSGSKSKGCPKPGSGKPSSKSMKQMQQQLNQQMKALQKAQKEGKKKGKIGNKGQGMSEQFARMAAEQAKIRRMMEEYQEQMLDETGTKPGGIGDMLKEMEKTEKDLVNKIINNETLKRQESIMTRLLKSEKAERQREKEKKRKSSAGKNVKRSNPKTFLEYKELKKKELNLLQTIPIDFNTYYKDKVDRYFFKFDNINDNAKK